MWSCREKEQKPQMTQFFFDFEFGLFQTNIIMLIVDYSSAKLCECSCTKRGTSFASVSISSRAIEYSRLERSMETI